MDITSLIARGIDPPADPVAAYTKLKQMVRGEEMSRLQLEEARRQNKLGQMGLEQHEQDRQDEQTWREALARHGGNTEAALTAAAGRVGAKSWFGLQQQLIKAQQERATTAKTEAETAKMEADFFGLLAYGVKAAEAAGGNKLDAFGAALDTAGRAYPIHRERVASLAKRIAQYPGELDTLLDTMIAHSPAAQELAIKQRQETRAQATEKRAAELHPLQVSKSTADAQLAGINAGAGAVGRITDQASLDAFLDANPAYRKLGLTEYKPDIVQFFRRAAISPHEQNMEAIASRNAENNVSESELQLRAAKGDLVARAALDRMHKDRVTVATQSRPVIHNTIPGVSMQSSQLSGEPYLKTLPPAFAAQVRAITEGKDAMPPANSRTPAAQQVRNAVYQYDPTFSTQRAQVRKAFTTGADGRNIGALNTAIVHLGRMAKTAEALKTGDFRPTNELYIYFKDRFGSAAVTNFELLKDAVSGEMAAALKGNATDIEIANVKRSIKASNSPDQMRGVVLEGMGILSDKANTYDERFHRENPDDPWSPILPSARQLLEQYGIHKPASGGGTTRPPLSSFEGKK